MSRDAQVRATYDAPDAESFERAVRAGSRACRCRRPDEPSVLDIVGGSSVEGTGVQTWDCNTTKTRRWKIRGAGQLVGFTGNACPWPRPPPATRKGGW